MFNPLNSKPNRYLLASKHELEAIHVGEGRAQVLLGHLLGPSGGTPFLKDIASGPRLGDGGLAG